jgi:2,3-dihydroxybenzoate decarboxylase
MGLVPVWKESAVVNEKPYLRIAAEEAWASRELYDAYRKVLKDRPNEDAGFNSLWSFYLDNPSPRPRSVLAKLTDLGEGRLRDMDATGIDKQLLLLTSPGVQVFDAPLAVELARSSNDQLDEAIRRYPARYAGLAAIAPQDPPAAAKELERGVKELGLRGGVVNSHTRGEYLDNAKFWPIFEAAEALDVPIYIHPQTPSPKMIEPFLERGLDGAIFGFGVETALHLMRIMVAGVFDRFPKLQIAVGHMGEGLPFWLYRLDYMHNATVAANRYESMKKTNRKISEYLRENVYITTSGMAWEPAILFTQKVIGMERVLYAMDYPYQFVPEEVKVHDNLPLADADKKKLFQTNAEKAFGLNR